MDPEKEGADVPITGVKIGSGRASRVLGVVKQLEPPKRSCHTHLLTAMSSAPRRSHMEAEEIVMIRPGEEIIDYFIDMAGASGNRKKADQSWASRLHRARQEIDLN